MIHKLIQFTFSLVVVVCLISSCKSKQYTFKSYEGNRIAIGSSGGFTGASIKYYLFENGQIFKRNSNGVGYTELEAVDKNVMQQQFDNYYKFGFDKLELDDPGNLSYFIIMNPDSDNIHMLKWGGGNIEPSPVLNQYYKVLSGIIKTHNKTLK